MGRRSQGDGTVFYDDDRKCWVGQVEAGRDLQTGRRRRPKVSAPTKRKCQELLDELRDELRVTGSVAPRDTTVAQVIADLMEHPPAKWRSPITRRGKRDLAKRITGALGTVPVVKLTARQVERMLRNMVREGLATSTIAQTRSLLRLALHRAQRDKLVAQNVAALAELPTGTVRPSRSMSREQINALLALPGAEPWWLAYLMTAIGCGLRPGELLGLLWADVDLDAGVIHVRHALHQEPDEAGHKHLFIGELKSETSLRSIRMPARVLAALRTHRTAQAATRLRAGSRWQDQDIVFCGPRGLPRDPEGVRGRFRRACKRAGLGAGWHPHEQRHTFVSVLSDGGQPIEAIAAAVGHRNSAITKKVYWHAIKPVITTAAEAMNDALGEPDGKPE